MIAKLRSAVSAALICFLLLQNQKALGWGNEGHVYISSRVAAQKIPSDMPSFFRNSVAEIAYLGPEPDRWRGQFEFALKNAQEPDHFIDLERVAWLDPLPQGRYEFYRKLYEKRAAATEHPDDYLPERVGLQPYITIEIYGRLKAAFREYRALRQQHKPTAPVQHAIVFYAGWLGHYVADGAQPLHTTIHYNGWVGPNPNGYTAQRGIHSQFESIYVAQNIASKDFSNLVHSPERLADPFGQYVAYLKDSNRLVEKVYELEKAGALNGKGSAEAFDFTTHRLATGAQMLLDLWYTAWLESAGVIDGSRTFPIGDTAHVIQALCHFNTRLLTSVCGSRCTRQRPIQGPQDSVGRRGGRIRLRYRRPRRPQSLCRPLWTNWAHRRL